MDDRKRPCPSCGWPNGPGADACEFCTAPLARASGTTTSLRVELATCPHCGAQTAGADLLGRCPRCGRGYQETRTQTRRAAAQVVVAARGVEPGRVWVGVALVAVLFVMVRLLASGGDPVVATAESINRLGGALRAWAAAHGGFPANLDALDPVDVPGHLLADGWERPVRYRALGAKAGYSEDGIALYPSCELRSAGPDGELDGGDDLVLHQEAARAATAGGRP